MSIYTTCSDHNYNVIIKIKQLLEPIYFPSIIKYNSPKRLSRKRNRTLGKGVPMNQRGKLNVYMGLNIIVGLWICASGAIAAVNNQEFQYFIYFVILSVIAESYIIQVSEGKYISIGFAVGLAGILVFDPSIAASIIFLGTLLRIYNEEGVIYHVFNSSAKRRLFTSSAYAISACTASLSYQWIGIHSQFDKIYGYSATGILGAIGTYIFVNCVIFTLFKRITEGKEAKETLKEMNWIILNCLGIAPVGIILTIAFEKSGWLMMALILTPLVMARHSFKLYIDMKQQYFETIKTLSNALDAKDNYTNGHSMRVAELSVLIAKNMQMMPNHVEVIKTAAVLHDIGKIGISDAIINKPGRLDMSEIYEIRRHPEIGEQILRDVKALKKIAKIVKHHHERYDGNGYPDSLRGEEIPLESAIISVADAFDAMTSNRIYRLAMTEERAIEAICMDKGMQFHPEVVESFEACVGEFIARFAEKHEDEPAEDHEEVC